MLVWVILLVVVSGVLFAQNVSTWANWHTPPLFWLTILWSVLTLLIALGILTTLLIERRTRGRPRAASRLVVSKQPSAPEVPEPPEPRRGESA